MQTKRSTIGATTRQALALWRVLPPPIQNAASRALQRFALFFVLIAVIPVLIVVLTLATIVYAVVNWALGSPSGVLGSVLAYGWLATWIVSTVVVTVRIWHAIPIFTQLKTLATDGLDLVDEPRPDPPADPTEFETVDERIARADARLAIGYETPVDAPPAWGLPPTGVISAQHLSLLEARGGALTVFSAGSVLVMALESRGRRRGSTSVQARIRTKRPDFAHRPPANHPVLRAQGWQPNEDGSELVRSWTIDRPGDRVTLRREVDSALAMLADDGCCSRATSRSHTFLRERPETASSRWAARSRSLDRSWGPSAGWLPWHS